MGNQSGSLFCRLVQFDSEISDVHFPSIPLQFYDFEGIDAEWSGLRNVTDAQYLWEDKKESAHFRGSCWYYKGHGRTAAVTMSHVAPDMVDAAWYDEIRTDMLEKDGLPQFGEIERAVSPSHFLPPRISQFWR